jgi:predicted TIM-barrel fold metal-dependent hydrolase
MTVNLDWLISVDDHVLEPPQLWQERVPKPLRHRAPKLVRDETGEWWEYDGNRIGTVGLSAMAGKSKREFSPLGMRYDEMRTGCYDSRARLEDMDEAGVLASLCFPSFPRFCGQIFTETSDRELGLACVQAYNDWMIEEWSGSAPGRFIPMIILPLWDAQLASQEVLRCAAKGAKALAFSENPTKLGLPSIYDPQQFWDPVWAACNETGIVVCMHIGSSSTTYAPADVSPQVVRYILSAPTGITFAFVDWLFAPPFRRYENLKIALSEGSIGWMPYYLERCEYTVDHHRAWVTSFQKTASGMYETPQQDFGVPDLDQFDVREIFRKHVFGCFIDDLHGVKNIRDIGIDNVMIETDYPHSDSTWPNCIEHAHKQLSSVDLTDDEKYKVLRGNAERVFNFTPAAPPL